MMLLDTSAVLGYLQREPGWEMIEAVIAADDATLSVVNQTEVLSKLSDWGMDLSQAQQTLNKLGLRTEPFTDLTAVEAAKLRSMTRTAGLSLGDRACLATARLRQCAVLTGDRPWLALAPALGLSISSFRPDTH